MDKLAIIDIDGVFNSEAFYVRRHNSDWHNQHIAESNKYYDVVPPEIKDNWDKKSKFLKEYYTKEQRDEHHIHSCMDEFDPLAVKRFNRIIDATGAKLVISSTWRSDPLIKEILKRAGVKGEVIGCTPRLNWTDIEVVNPFTDKRPHIPRGLEIDYWLDSQYDWDNKKKLNFIIIDDDSDMLFIQRDNFVKTSWKTGLLNKHVHKAIKILNKGENDEV